MYHLTEAYLMITLICLLAAFLGALSFAVTSGARGVASLYNHTDQPGSFNWSMRMHRFAVWGATVFTLTITVGSTFSAVPVIYTLLVVTLSGLMSICYLLAWQTLPRIRETTSAHDQKKPDSLVRFARVMLSGGMLLTLCVIAALAYVLPGHFTYYPVEPGAASPLFAGVAQTIEGLPVSSP